MRWRQRRAGPDEDVQKLDDDATKTGVRWRSSRGGGTPRVQRFLCQRGYSSEFCRLLDRPESGKPSVEVCRCFRIRGLQMDRSDSVKSSAVHHSLSFASLLPSSGPPGLRTSGDHSSARPMVAPTRDYSNNFLGRHCPLPLTISGTRRHSSERPAWLQLSPLAHSAGLCRWTSNTVYRGSNVLPFMTSAPRRHRTAGPLRISCHRASNATTRRGNIFPFVTSSAPRQQDQSGETLNSLAGPVRISRRRVSCPYSFPIAVSPSFEKEGRTYGWNTS